MPKVEFKRVQTDAEVENIDIKDGQLIYTGTGKTYMDYGNERIPTGSGGSSVDVDTEMSDTSENAVQNKVIKEYVDDQIDSIPEEVIVSDTQPTSDDWKLWIDSDKQTDNTYYNDNGTPTNIKTTTYDTLPVGTEVDYDGNTVPTGWTEIEDIQPNVYSTTEQKIGTWIDGKPIYRKVLNPTVSGTGYLQYSHGISNFSHIVKAYGYFLRNSGTVSWQVINKGASDGEPAFGFDICDITSSVYHLLIGTSYTNVANCYVILEYTKTTD